MCLEFSKVTTPGVDSLYDFYSFQIIPPMGKVSLPLFPLVLETWAQPKNTSTNFQVLAGDWDSYQYLVESIRQFPPQEEFAQMIKDAGFRCSIWFMKTELCLIVSDLWILKTSLSEWLQSILVSNCDNILYWILSPTLASCTLNLFSSDFNEISWKAQ